MYANYWTVDFKDDDTQDNYGTGLRLDWTRWRDLSISIGTDYTKRTSNVPTEEYTEWSGLMTVLYSLVGQRRAR